MKLFHIIAVLLTLSAAFGYLNHRYIKLPTTIGTMLISMVVSVGIVVLGHFGGLGFDIKEHWLSLIQSIDFNETVLVGMLGFLLFAGALHVNLTELLRQKWEVSLLSTIGTVLSTVLIGTITFGASQWLGLNLDVLHCMLFGALISPTDPIAVLGILRSSGVPKDLEVIISGESLFNDGVGVVLFLVLMQEVTNGHGTSAGATALLFFQEFGGGIILGLILGWISFLLLKSIDNYHVEILITLSLVTGGYALANALHTSGPITMVVAGLLIGNHGRRLAMSEQTRHNLDTFWELVDQILNSLLFVLIGLEVLVVSLSGAYIFAGLLMIVTALTARLLSIGVPLLLLPSRKTFGAQALTIMTWGGLRGGISVALALSLPRGPERDTIIAMTYIVVVFSILVQGSSVKYLMEPNRLMRKMRDVFGKG